MTDEQFRSLAQVTLLILVILIIYATLKGAGYFNPPAGFENNNYYFQGNENDSMYVGRLIQPTLKHKINIPTEW